MKLSQYFIPSVKETPADAELASHQLLIRAGMIRKQASGLYSWLPLGLRVLRKVEAVVRKEMNAIGAMEVSLPTVTPAELWQESGRWDAYGKELLRFTDRHDREFCYGPTFEEAMVDLVRRDVNSYKQLPVTFYQIDHKFRDEIRPRFGLMRGREFIMKDAYSFHDNLASLQQTYQDMHHAYCRIFDRLGLNYRAVLADSGAIGGDSSQEFHVLADSGEDMIAYCEASDYAANVERAESYFEASQQQGSAPLEKVATPGVKSIADLCAYLNLPADQTVKTLLVKGVEHEVVALVLRGDHELNEIKAQKLNAVASPLTFASEDEIKATVGCAPGSIGPSGLNIPIIVDRDASNLIDFVAGANEDGYHVTGMNWQRDAVATTIADIRNVQEGDMSPDQKGPLKFVRGIEVGHIFQNGDKYTKAMQATVLGENGKAVTLLTGCYGIGISRIVAAAVEQNHDDKGIVWPKAMAPFQVVILPMNMQKSFRVKEAAENLYQQLIAAGIEVLFFDTKERPGVMFSTADLLGIPYRVVIGEKGLDQGEVEFKIRHEAEAEQIKLEDVIANILS